jgi:4,5-DOPA dioxygenase extradiol
MWTPLMLMYPAADIPLVMVSLPHNASAETYFQMGRALRELRDDNVLLIGSGSYTHNLWQLSRDGSAPKPGPKPLHTGWTSLAGKPSTGHPQLETEGPLAGKITRLTNTSTPAGDDGGGSDNTAPVKLHDDWRMGSLSMACWQFD